MKKKGFPCQWMCRIDSLGVELKLPILNVCFRHGFESRSMQQSLFFCAQELYGFFGNGVLCWGLSGTQMNLAWRPVRHSTARSVASGGGNLTTNSDLCL